MSRLDCLFIKYFSVIIEQLKSKSRSGPLTFFIKQVVRGLEKVEKHCHNVHPTVNVTNAPLWVSLRVYR